MNLFRKLALAATLSVIAWISVALVVAQSVRIDGGPFFHGRQIVRLWQDFELRASETSRDVLVVSGSTTISGRVEGDVVAVLGPVRLESTAEVRGSLVVVAGDVTVVEGAKVTHDFMVFGGGTTLPVSFYPGGEHVAIGNAWMGAQLRAVVPWVTYGLLWGRLIVVSIGWVWWFVAIALILTMAINLMLHGAVGHAADTLATRPASAFMTGLLMLLLTGPIAVLLGATIIGLAIVPFVLCAVVVAWIVGKVAVSRWIGRTILGYGPDDTRQQALLAVVVGFASICLLYAVPLVGLVTWALVGVLGLGAASLTVMSALRRERGPRRKARRDPAAEDAAAPAPPAPPLEHPGMAFVAAEPVYEPPIPPIPPVPPPPPMAPMPPAAQAMPGAAGLALTTRATFLDRVAAGALDVAFVLFVFNAFLDRFLLVSDAEAQFVLLLAYFVTFWAWKGTTLGGIVCNLRVVRLNGAPLAGADAIVRGLASIFSFVPFGLGFFWILRDPHQQAWHDTISGTCVVKVPRDYPL
jgi:uncharacterized RDD family membrane protein YckC